MTPDRSVLGSNWYHYASVASDKTSMPVEIDEMLDDTLSVRVTA